MSGNKNKKMKIKKGDTVKITAGKDNGKTGAVDKVYVKENKLMVAGVNLFKRHVKKSEFSEGGMIEIAKPVDASNVMLVCPNCKKPTRVGFEVTKTGKKRICKKCRKEIS